MPKPVRENGLQLISKNIWVRSTGVKVRNAGSVLHCWGNLVEKVKAKKINLTPILMILMILTYRFVWPTPIRTTEGEEDIPLTVGILFSLDRCLLMGDPNSFGSKFIPKSFTRMGISK